MSACPNLPVRMGGILVPCLVDTGSMVSTMTESFFSKNFGHGARSAYNHVNGCSFVRQMAWGSPTWVT